MIAPPLQPRFRRTVMERAYHGISYPLCYWLMGKEWVFWAWRRFMCPRGFHLFDEVVKWGGDDGNLYSHFLHCNACGLTVYIKSIVKGVVPCSDS